MNDHRKGAENRPGPPNHGPQMPTFRCCRLRTQRTRQLFGSSSPSSWATVRSTLSFDEDDRSLRCRPECEADSDRSSSASRGILKAYPIGANCDPVTGQRSAKGLLQIGQQVFGVLQPHAQPDQRIGQSAAQPFLAGDARMRHAGRMPQEGFHTT